MLKSAGPALTVRIAEPLMPAFSAPKKEHPVAEDPKDWDIATKLSKLNGPVWIAFHHEPENDGDITLWTKMQARLAQVEVNEERLVSRRRQRTRQTERRERLAFIPHRAGN